jgi:hypothetical protein
MKYEQNKIHKKKTIIFNKKVDQVVLTIFYHRVRYPVSNKDQFMNDGIAVLIVTPSEHTTSDASLALFIATTLA